MKFFEQKLPGVWLIKGDPYTDNRGAFRRNFCTQEYREHGLNPLVVQTNISQNYKQHTLRGFHLQQKPFGEDKTLCCFFGVVFDIVLDLRVDSPTFLQWMSLELDAQKIESLYVPQGCANAYMSLTDNTMMLYYMSEFYHPESSLGVRYNDPFFKFVWPVEPLIISDKDRAIANFDPDVYRTANSTLK